jgi:hypothetical protein
MSQALFELGASVLEVLRVDSPLNSLMERHVYSEQPPHGTKMPWVFVGDMELLDVSDGDEHCEAVSYEVYVPVHVYSRFRERPQADKIAGAVLAALRNARPEMIGHTVLSFLHRVTRTERDPDTTVDHRIVEFTVLMNATP